jgi:serine/threonine-protein kinase
MTLDGTVIGTRGYMAPEQAAGSPDVDGRADVYALGCVLFEILAGEPLHVKGSTTVVYEPSVRAPGRDVPPELDAICVAATLADRATRIQTPRELGERVERFLDGDRDVARRQQLAHAHLDAARVAFAADDEAAHPTAMREAGRALALDPTLAGAGELVGRLMIEPPRVRPPDMDAMIKADEMETLRRMARAGALGYLGYLCFLPLVVSGSEMLGYLAALLSILALNIYLLLDPRFYKNLKTRAFYIVLGNSAMVAILARMASPFLIAPSVAALGTMALVFSPTYQRMRGVALLAISMGAAVLVPWLLEALDVLEPTLSLTADGLAITPPLLDVGDPAKVAVLVLYVVAIVGAAAAMAFQNRRAERIVRDRIHLQAWRLRQLVS